MPARDPAELYKDKVEVSLDGRQIFYLFFGGAVIVGLVFVLGVMVGRRVEARGHVDPARTAAAADPLAALDRLEGSGAMSFKGSLTAGGAAAPTAVERAIEERAAAVPTPAAPAPAAARPVDKPAEKPAEKAEKPADRAEKADKPAEKADKKPDKPDKPERKRFTLQLSSFQDKQEAETFMANLRAAGYQPTLSEAEVSGKGTFYRVRLGTYRTIDAANDAKPEVERVSKKTASVVRL